MTYPKARLYLGTTGVGTWVTLSLVLLLDPPQPWELLLLWVLVSFPLDLLGGQILPRQFDEPVPGFLPWFRKWARAVGVQVLIFSASGALLMMASAPQALVAVQAAILVALVALQDPIARATGAIQKIRSTSLMNMPATLYQSEDPDFSGGISGLPGCELLALPRGWPGRVALVLMVRRRLLVESGSRSLGVIVAAAWNLTGFALASYGGISNGQDLSRTALLFTLWSFLGLLILPKLSHKGAQYADYLTLKEVSLDNFQHYLDWTEDEAEGTSTSVERTFYPIPSRESRLRALRNKAKFAPWNVARMALFLSWGCWGLLGRAVHCNTGRPALWVYLPVD